MSSDEPSHSKPPERLSAELRDALEDARNVAVRIMRGYVNYRDGWRLFDRVTPILLADVDAEIRALPPQDETQDGSGPLIP